MAVVHYVSRVCHVKADESALHICLLWRGGVTSKTQNESCVNMCCPQQLLALLLLVLLLMLLLLLLLLQPVRNEGPSAGCRTEG